MTQIADFNTIKIGAREHLVRKITETDIRRFVEMTGDDNPLHVDRQFAATTALKDIVVHGMLGASFISTLIGTKLPGAGALWLTQNMEFLLPVRLGDLLTVSCVVLNKHERERMLELEMMIVNQNQQLVLKGRGKVKLLASTAKTLRRDTRPKDLVAIVTGASGGIGSAISARLSKLGYNVVLNYSTQRAKTEALAKELSSKHARAVAVCADVSSELGCETLIREALGEFGSVSVLVNNASPRINPKRIEVTSWKDIQLQLDVQVKGALMLSQACIPSMASHKFGRIVNITSEVAGGPPTPTWTAYAVAKAALTQLTRYIASECGVSGITVNAVAPGMTSTALIGDISEKSQEIVARQTPLRRLATPEDIASAVSFLVSEEASFITGQTISVNGGKVML